MVTGASGAIGCLAIQSGTLRRVGVRNTAHAADAVAGTHAVLTMLSDDTAVREVIDEAGPAMQQGAVWMQSTTVGVDDVPELAALTNGLGVAFVDPHQLLGLIEGGPLDSGYLHENAGLIMDDAFTPPSFSAAAAGKDASSIITAAARAGDPHLGTLHDYLHVVRGH